jgi:hypothetical protein
MIELRRSTERGYANHGWLESRHTFSFADYHDPQRMHFRSLRVINEDHIAPGAGFPTHPHRDMEILTYVVSGAVAHRDTTGGEGVIRPGQMQHMSAGLGVQHSEFNASATESLHLLQIWILPNERGLTPRYRDTDLSKLPVDGHLRLVASPDGRDGTLHISQDVLLWVGNLEGNASFVYAIRSPRAAWIQLISGKISVNGVLLEAGDAVALTSETEAQFAVTNGAHFLLFDLA